MYKPLNDLKQISNSKKLNYDYASIFIKPTTYINMNIISKKDSYSNQIFFDVIKKELNEYKK
jgi:hypothetical protein